MIDNTMTKGTNNDRQCNDQRDRQWSTKHYPKKLHCCLVSRGTDKYIIYSRLKNENSEIRIRFIGLIILLWTDCNKSSIFFFFSFPFRSFHVFQFWGRRRLSFCNFRLSNFSIILKYELENILTQYFVKRNDNVEENVGFK